MNNLQNTELGLSEIQLNETSQSNINTVQQLNETKTFSEKMLITIIIAIHIIIASIIIIGNIYFLLDNKNYGCLIYEYRYTSLIQLFVVEIIMCIFILIVLLIAQVHICTNKVYLSESSITILLCIFIGSYIGTGLMNITTTYLFAYRLQPSNLCTKELVTFIITTITVKWIIFGIVFGLFFYFRYYERRNLF